MGYLDHSTNNIILDAVLTDYGRSQLAKANGSFSISYFSLGDDELDYSLIKKYGRTVGKEKIEKNTPIFEALTNENLALKYSLVGMENNGTSVIYMPILTPSLASLSIVKTADGNKNSATVNFSLTVKGSEKVEPELMQNSYKLKISDRFFYVDGSLSSKISLTSSASSVRSLVNPADPNKTAEYSFTTESTNFSINIVIIKL